MVDVAADELRYLRAGQQVSSELRRSIVRIVRRKDIAEELLQETYLRLYRAGKRNEPAHVSSLFAYVFTVARNLALDYVRRAQLDPVDLSSDLGIADATLFDVPDHSPDPAEAVNADQELRLLRRAAATLPKRCRQVFTLRKVYDLPQREIAARLGISEDTVEAHLKKAMRRVAHILGPHLEKEEPR